MLTVIVIDDEPLAIVTISQIIVQYIHNVQLLGTASNITTGMQLIQQ